LWMWTGTNWQIIIFRNLIPRSTEVQSVCADAQTRHGCVCWTTSITIPFSLTSIEKALRKRRRSVGW
jgi:hypothetical protein